MHFAGIVLGRVVHGAQSGLAEQGVGIEIDLGVQAEQIAVLLDHQRIHLHQGQIVLLEQLGQTDEDMGELLELIAFETQPEGQVAGLERLGADQGVDAGLEDLLGRFMGDLLDVHPALGRGHEDDAAARAIDHRSQVKLPLDLGAGLDQDLADRLPRSVGLVGHQSLAQPVDGEDLRLLPALDQLDATGLATTAGMHLDLRDPAVAANPVAGLRRGLRGIDGNASGHG